MPRPTWRPCRRPSSFVDPWPTQVVHHKLRLRTEAPSPPGAGLKQLANAVRRALGAPRGEEVPGVPLGLIVALCQRPKALSNGCTPDDSLCSNGFFRDPRLLSLAFGHVSLDLDARSETQVVRGVATRDADGRVPEVSHRGKSERRAVPPHPPFFNDLCGDLRGKRRSNALLQGMKCQKLPESRSHCHPCKLICQSPPTACNEQHVSSYSGLFSGRYLTPAA